MSYIAVELKVIEGLAGQVARASGVTEDRVLAGLVRLWHRCWSTTSDLVTRPQLAGVMGFEGLDGLAAALENLGFLEAIDGAWRVRGAARYLRLKAARSVGAAKTNAARSRASVSDALERSGASLADALTPNTEHRAPNTSSLEAKVPHPLQAIWNELKAPEQPTWRETSKARKAKADVRWKDCDDWPDVVKRIAASSFCRGTNDRGWIADPEWLLKPDTATKVLEGKYDNRGGGKVDHRAPVAAETVQWKPEDAGEVLL